MALDTQAQAFLDSMHSAESMSLAAVSVEQSRREFSEVFSTIDVPRVEIGRRKETTVTGPAGDVPIRLYWPDAEESGKPHAAIVLIHGGGWVLGSVDDYENLARGLCVDFGMVICSVEYRLAPENKFPAGLGDACAVVRWMGENAADLEVDPKRIGVAGDSAGGNIAAAACLVARDDETIHIAAQILLYSAFTAASDYTSPSREELGNGEYQPSRVQLEWAIDNYIASDSDRTNPLVSPLLAEDLAGLPPAVIVTAGYDAFRDEGREYADRLQAASVPVAYECFENTIHGFWCYAGVLDPNSEYRDYVANEAKRVLA